MVFHRMFGKVLVNKVIVSVMNNDPKVICNAMMIEYICNAPGKMKSRKHELE